MIKQSFSWWCFENRGVDPIKLLYEAKRIGYQGVDLIHEEYWKEARKMGLTIVNIAGHRPLEKGFNHMENHDALEVEVKKNLELAVEFQIPYITVFAGNKKGINDEIGLKNTVIGLNRIIKQAERLNVTLVLELLNSKIDHPDHQCDRTTWGRAVCEIINSPNMKLLFDIYHMQVMEGDIIHTIQENLSYIAHFHTAGVPGRNNIDETQELNFRSITQGIVDMGYKGFIGHEFLPKNDPISALEQAYNICNF